MEEEEGEVEEIKDVDVGEVVKAVAGEEKEDETEKDEAVGEEGDGLEKAGNEELEDVVEQEVEADKSEKDEAEVEVDDDQRMNRKGPTQAELQEAMKVLDAGVEDRSDENEEEKKKANNGAKKRTLVDTTGGGTSKRQKTSLQEKGQMQDRRQENILQVGDKLVGRDGQCTIISLTGGRMIGHGDLVLVDMDAELSLYKRRPGTTLV
jgi:hypothetical protein